jgi:uncharacterized membrane protein YdjX (TVP38/TMEM64 family)
LEEFILYSFAKYENAAVLISIMINCAISVMGVIPSAFLTGANLLFFGFEKGLLISMTGEIIGAFVSFIFYRKGIHLIKANTGKLPAFVEKLKDVKGWSAFKLLLALRLLPFVPSGLVTAVAATSSVSLWLFMAASAIGKIPSVVIEALTVQQVMKNSGLGKAIFVVAAVFLLVHFFKKRASK